LIVKYQMTNNQKRKRKKKR